MTQRERDSVQPQLVRDFLATSAPNQSTADGQAGSVRKRGFSDSSMQLEAGLRTEADETPQPPCCLARCWCCDKSSLRISGGSGRDTCLEVHKLLRVAVTIHRAQGSPSHSHADSLGGLGLDCLPRTHVRARGWGTSGTCRL